MEPNIPKYDALGYLYGVRFLRLDPWIDNLDQVAQFPKLTARWRIPALRSMTLNNYHRWGDGNATTVHSATCHFSGMLNGDFLRPEDHKFFDCHCGFHHFYGAKDTDWFMLPYLWQQTPRWFAMLVTRNWGRVVHHETGFRSEFTQIVYGSLFLPAMPRQFRKSSVHKIRFDDTRARQYTRGLTALSENVGISTVQFTNGPAALTLKSNQPFSEITEHVDATMHRIAAQGMTKSDRHHLPAQVKRLRSAVKAVYRPDSKEK